MHWNDSAIVLSARKHGENSAVVRVFAAEHGVFAGVIKGATSKTNRGIIQPGNIVNAAWNARLSEQLGILKLELLEAGAALIMQDAAKLSALSSACALIESALPERHPYPKFYAIFEAFLTDLKNSEDWPEAYVKLELALLAEAGFGLDLRHCAATGTTENLIYVSPKSGRAVSTDAGEPYKDKMLPLPSFLLPSPLRGEGQGGGDPKNNNNHVLIPKARQLRGDMTDAEQHLWYHLRTHRFKGYSFRRQQPISENYIVDFVCLDKKLIVELDGGQHAEQQAYDNERTLFLENEGYRVMRFWNNEIFENIEGVLTVILQMLETVTTITPSLTLPPQGGGDIKKAAEILAGMQLTGYFLEHWLLEPHRRKLPAARRRLMEMMKEYDGAEAKTA